MEVLKIKYSFNVSYNSKCCKLTINVRVVSEICTGTTQKYIAFFSHQSYQNEWIGCLVVKVNTLKVIYLFWFK